MAEKDEHTRLFPGLARQLRDKTGEKTGEAAPAGGAPAGDQPPRRGNVLPFRPLPDDPGPAPQTWADDGGRRRVSLRRVLALVLLVLAVLAALGALMWGAAVDMDALRRSYTYRGVNRDSRGVTDSLPLPEDWIAAAPMGRRLALASGLGLQLLDEDGSELASCVATLASPALRVEKKAALAYDVGKATICVIDSALRSQVIDAGAPVLAADVSAGGGICYLTSAEEDKTVLTVRSSQMSEVFTWHSKSRYLTTAALSDNGQMVAAVGAGTNGGAYQSTLLLLRTDSETPVADVDLGDQLVLWADWVGGSCCLVCHDQVLIYSSAGELLGSYAAGGKTITGVSAGGGFVLLSLSEGRTGDRDMLVTLDASGSVRAEVTLGCQASQISAAGDYAAVLTPQGLCLYDSGLHLYGQLEEPGVLTRCAARDDGSVLLISSQGCALYLP